MNIENLLKQDSEKDLLRFTTAGSVDDGKSTLIGRLLCDSKQIYEDQVASVKNASGKINNDLEIDYSLVTDGLKAEREQGITIDVAYRYFSTPSRKFIIADTPGHEQYTRNMVTGASTANLAIVLIDARHGVLVQSKRHAFIASLLGIPHVIVAINKMDLVDYKEEVFEKIKKQFSEFATKLNIPDIHFVPISALKGDNVVESGQKNMPWHKGSSLLEYLESVYIASDRNLIDLRFPVQGAIRPSLDFRGYSGTVVSGIVRKGDEIMALPSHKTSRIKSIVTFDGEIEQAVASESVVLVLEDELDISRGDMIIHKHNTPRIQKHFEAMLVWMDEEPFDSEKIYLIKHTTRSEIVRIDELRYKLDVNTVSRKKANALTLNEIGRVVFSSRKDLFFDPYEKNRSTGSFILIDRISNKTVGAGMILDREPGEELPSKISEPIGKTNASGIKYSEYSKVPMERKAERMNQKPVTIWLTGLVASGKREIAYALEKQIFNSGSMPIVLDARNLRSRMSSELEFSAIDRAENLRRAAEISRIMNSNGLISICAFVSPSAYVREEAKKILGADKFIEVFVDAPLDFCEKRDKAGFYEKAKRGEIKNATGVTAPYEPPVNPDICLKSNEMSIDDAAQKIFEFLKEKNIIS